MAPQSNLSDRLKAFADRFAALGRPSRPGGGYSGLAGGPGGGAGGLGAPLVVGGGGGGSTGGSEGYYSSGGVAAPPQSRYDPPQTTSHGQQQSYGSLDVAGGGDAGAGAAVNLPTQVRFLKPSSSSSMVSLFFFLLMGEERHRSTLLCSFPALLLLCLLSRNPSMPLQLASHAEKEKRARGQEKGEKKTTRMMMMDDIKLSLSTSQSINILFAPEHPFPLDASSACSQRETLKVSTTSRKEKEESRKRSSEK